MSAAAEHEDPPAPVEKASSTVPEQAATDPLAPWPDTVDWRPVSPRLAWAEQARLGALLVVVLAAAAVAGIWIGRWPAVAVAAVALLTTALRAVFVVRSVRAWGYAEREVDLVVRHGLFVRRLSIVPYARMQFVDVTAGPLERALGLATVQMHTAAAASNARVPGLASADAARLRDRLTALGEVHLEGL
jgi:membrane protein YdbS with pleckstrin-like domain